MKLVPGLYEALLTRDRAEAIRLLENLAHETDELSVESAPAVLARHLHTLLVKAFQRAPGDDKLTAQVELANRLVDEFASLTPDAGIDVGDRVDEPGRLLLSLREIAEQRLGAGGAVRRLCPFDKATSL